MQIVIQTFENVSFVIGTREYGVDFSITSAQLAVASVAIVEGHRRCRRPTREGSETGFCGHSHILFLAIKLLNV